MNELNVAEETSDVSVSRMLDNIQSALKISNEKADAAAIAVSNSISYRKEKKSTPKKKSAKLKKVAGFFTL